MRKISFFPSARERGYRTRALIISYALAAFAVAAGFIWQNKLLSENYKRAVINNYRHAFTELATDVSELNATLNKCIHAGTGGMVTETCVEVYGASTVAKQSLGGLPNSDREFEQTGAFLSRVGDYAFSLAKKTARGSELSDEERNNLRAMSDAMGVLAGNLNALVNEVGDGRVTLEELDAISRSASKRGDDATKNVFTGRVKLAEDAFPEIPTLVYDGPFSSHIADMKPRFLEGKSEVTQEDAQKTAQDFSGLTNLSFDGERGGNLPVYMYSAADGGGTVNLEVSKAGGVVVNMYSSRIPADGRVSADDAVKKALEFMEKHNYADMRESYRMSDGNVCTINFVSEKNGVLIYPDHIEVEVALDDGSIVGFMAQGYVMHSHERTIPSPAVPESDARAKVAKNLTVLAQHMAIIPTGGENEVFCYEYKCENGDGNKYAVYINAETGEEQQILMLIESENGTLAM